MGARGASTFPSHNRLPYPFSLVVRPLFCFVVCWHSLPFQDKYVSGDSVNFRGSDSISSPSADEKFDEETNPLKFLYYRQMVSYFQVLVRSLMRKQTFEVSLLPSNGILPPSAGKKFDEETNL